MVDKELSVKGLTWKDVNTLDMLIDQVRHEFPNGMSEKSFGLAVLEKFQDYYHGYDEGGADMREEMLKDACDTKITTDKNSIFPIIKYQLPLTYDCKIGDKVKIIIVKED